MKIYTQQGDDGFTGLFMGGRVSKASLGPETYGSVDEAVAKATDDRAFTHRFIEAFLSDPELKDQVV